jgi:hypothetical protein
MKNLKNLRGAKVLSTKEQQVLKGGTIPCNSNLDCPIGRDCWLGWCFLSPPERPKE